MIVGALDSTMSVRSAPGVAVTHGVVLAGATFVELEVKAEGLPLAVDQVAHLGTRAEGGLSVTKRILMAPPCSDGACGGRRYRKVGSWLV
jgi:hypothetical protein